MGCEMLGCGGERVWGKGLWGCASGAGTVHHKHKHKGKHIASGPANRKQWAPAMLGSPKKAIWGQSGQGLKD
jgi:hypothetical protein